MMQEIERVAAILKPSETMLNWINEYHSEEETLQLDDVQVDCTVILLPAFDSEAQAEIYLNDIFDELFVNELATWNDDDSTWPSERSLEMFLEWFDIEFHSLVYDAGQGMQLMREARDTILQ